MWICAKKICFENVKKKQKSFRSFFLFFLCKCFYVVEKKQWNAVPARVMIGMYYIFCFEMIYLLSVYATCLCIQYSVKLHHNSQLTQFTTVANLSIYYFMWCLRLWSTILYWKLLTFYVIEVVASIPNIISSPHDMFHITYNVFVRCWWIWVQFRLHSILISQSAHLPKMHQNSNCCDKYVFAHDWKWCLWPLYFHDDVTSKL